MELIGSSPAFGCALGGRHYVAIGQDETACVHVKFAAIQTLPPVGKQKGHSPQLLTYIQALEMDPPAGRPPIDWKLVTNLPVGDFAIAIEKLEWNALRWKAEVFHKVMKSGCRAEEARLETAERLTQVPRPRRDGQLAHLLPHHVRTSEARGPRRRQSSPQPKSRLSMP
jgi:hypothetical protein